jgi:hypothetical protein
MRHANISTTMNIHSRAFPESTSKANTFAVQRVLVQDRTKWQKAVTMDGLCFHISILIRPFQTTIKNADSS